MPRCKVSPYGLSAHASGIQIAGLLRALRPSDVFLVHGDADARHGLADLLVRERLARVHLPAEGEPVSPPARRAPRAGGDG
ncbi:MAG: MBL fold metallo-hydrolase RNA specificity domain-containing protein, partial [Planctomycetota bacterium]